LQVEGLEVVDAVDLLLVGAGFDRPTSADRRDAEDIVKVTSSLLSQFTH
jgi:hypothetical protein